MLFSPFRPSEARARSLLGGLRDAPFSYRDVGMIARGFVPKGYVEDRSRQHLGQGAGAYALACQAIRAWTMFDLGWTEVWPPEAPIATGTSVAIGARNFGLWTVNPARIVAVIQETGPLERFGFAYGSLPGHAESGEEQFSVEWRHEDDSVWYDLRGVSRPGRWFSAAVRPLTRGVQRRFAEQSKAAMAAFVSRGGRT